MTDKSKPKPSPKDFVSYGDGHADVALSRGLDLAGAKVMALRMREPNVADQLVLDKMKGSDAENEIALLANLCALAPDDIKQLPLRDYRRVQAAFLGFQD
jgi:hypothetical protein